MPPLVPNQVIDIPNPHLERFIPELTRNFWAAVRLLPRILGREILADDERNGSTQELGEPSSSKPPLRQPPNGGGNQPPPIVGLAGPDEARRRQSAPNDEKLSTSEGTDPNYRQLTRVDVVGAAKKKIESPPLVPDAEIYPDPKFGQVLGPSEWTGSTGNDGGASGDDEGCDEEWADARKQCSEGFAKGTDQGPYSRRRDRPWSLEDCIRGIVSARCGGTPLKEGLSGEERAKRNNEMIRKKRKGLDRE
jgi:hypothetical protein